MLSEKSTAGRRYVKRISVTMLIYAVLIVTSAHGFKAWAPQGALKYLLALGPALPLLAVLAWIGLYIREETDEFRRMKVVYSLVIATGLTLAATTVWGFLEEFAGWPHVALLWTFPIFAVAMGVAQPVVSWRYR